MQVDPEALAGVGLSLEDVRTALAQATVDQPEGHRSAARPSTLDDRRQRSALRRRRISRVVVIVASHDGASVRLGDVAHVIDDVENNRVAAWTNGKRAVLVIIRRQPGANIIETIDRVQGAAPALVRSISPAINVEIALDRTQTIRASVHDVELTLLISVALVVLVVFVFLRSARATAIPSVAVPLSLVGTFGVDVPARATASTTCR